MEYGFESEKKIPTACLSWLADLRKAPIEKLRSYSPDSLHIIFSSGDEYVIPEIAWEYTSQFRPSLFLPGADLRHNYSSSIFLSSKDLYAIKNGGNIANVYVEDNDGKITYLLDSSDLQKRINNP